MGKWRRRILFSHLLRFVCTSECVLIFIAVVMIGIAAGSSGGNDNGGVVIFDVQHICSNRLSSVSPIAETHWMERNGRWRRNTLTQESRVQKRNGLFYYANNIFPDFLCCDKLNFVELWALRPGSTRSARTNERKLNAEMEMIKCAYSNTAYTNTGHGLGHPYLANSNIIFLILLLLFPFAIFASLRLAIGSCIYI